MRVKRFIKTFALLAGISVFVWACEDQTKVCDQTLRSDFKMNFRTYDTALHDNKDTALPKVTLHALNMPDIYDGVVIGGLNQTEARGITYVTLPLDPQRDSTRFYIRADSTAKADTITLRYTRNPHFVSAGCGFTTFYSLDTVFSTNHSIDSLFLIVKQVTTTNDTHVTLYY